MKLPAALPSKNLGKNQICGHSFVKIFWLMLASLATTWTFGCQHHRHQIRFNTTECAVPCQSVLQQLEYTDIHLDGVTDGSDLVGQKPITISEFEEAEPWELTLEDCVYYTLANSDVLQKVGGFVVDNPGFANTIYDPALVESGVGGVEDALSAFDAQYAAGLFIGKTQRKFNNPIFGGGVNSLINYLGNYNASLFKQTAHGTTFGVTNLIDYSRSNIPLATPENPFGNRFASVYDVINRFEVRQPLLRGRGAAVNRIAGPNPLVGVYNGVLIARIRTDISLTDFEIAVRNLIRDVEQNYWELYFAYQNLETKLAARDSARATWENRKLRLERGLGRPDEEAQARQQYYTFENQVQNTLAGVPGDPGLLGSERNLRRLMGQLSSDGRIIRPISEPAVAPVSFDWEISHKQALERRAELRRQKWVVKQRELELFAARALNQWQFDIVGQHDNRGFGSQLFGLPGVEDGSALRSLFTGDLNDWRVGFELGGAIGNRRGYLAIRNAELNLVRERSLLMEQQRQITLDLNAAYTEVDRAYQVLKTNFNSFIAVNEELDPRRRRVQEGQDPVFFLLDAEQRAATAESQVHRAVVDYNLALLNFSFVSDDVLRRYGVVLSEGAWSETAQQNVWRNAERNPQGGRPRYYDVAPVTSGPHDQRVESKSLGGEEFMEEIDASSIFQVNPADSPYLLEPSNVAPD